MAKGRTFSQFWRDQKDFIRIGRKDLKTRKQRRNEARRLWRQIHKKNVHYQE